MRKALQPYYCQKVFIEQLTKQDEFKSFKYRKLTDDRDLSEKSFPILELKYIRWIQRMKCLWKELTSWKILIDDYYQKMKY